MCMVTKPEVHEDVKKGELIEVDLCDVAMGERISSFPSRHQGNLKTIRDFSGVVVG